jgi:diguanylate cyclase (GGDEF)-like protein
VRDRLAARHRETYTLTGGMAGADGAIMLVAGLATVAVAAVARAVVLQRRLRALAALAITDPLTGAFNRRHLDASLRTAIARQRRTGEGASLLVFDVDRFKWINDAIGHQGGDRVLTALAALVRARARKLDALFRIGGEEFALLLSGAAMRDAVVMAEQLRHLVQAARLADDCHVSVSIGVSDLRPGLSPEAWLEEADIALYRAKRAGRNRVECRPVDPLDEVVRHVPAGSLPRAAHMSLVASGLNVPADGVPDSADAPLATGRAGGAQ